MYPDGLNTPAQHPTVLPYPSYDAVANYPVPIRGGDLDPTQERRVVGYERYAGMLLPVFEAPPAVIQPPPATVPRGTDPIAQRLIAGGIGAGAAGAGVGWGVGQAVTGIAELGGSAGLAAILLLLLAARFGGGRTRIHNETHIHNTNRWLGRSHTTTHQR